MADGIDLKFLVTDKSGIYADKVEKLARREAGRAAKGGVKVGQQRARKKTGRMARGIDMQVRRKGDVIEAEIGGSDWKTPLHEFGTEKVPAKPMIQPALEELQREFVENLPEACEKLGDLV